jgi:peptide/nickel transport system ATP-binding protein
MSGAEILDVKNLSVRFNGRRSLFSGRGEDVRALSSISFSLEKGETLAVIGESGSGKTTLLRSALGLVAPTEGSVELFGRPVISMTGEERLQARRRCGYVLQDPYSSLPPTLTVLGAVLEPWNIVHKNRDEREAGIAKAHELLSELKLPEEIRGARVRYSLSGGQRQRVAIARALILEPELLLCDEPTAMQDVSTRGEVLDVLERRVKNGMSMIIVTHDLLLAKRAASRGIVLYRGEIADAGGTAQLIENPAHDYTKALIAALPKL